jgi:hypothetical protein
MAYNTQLQCLHYSRKSLQAILDLRTTRIFVRFTYSPLIHFLYIELGLLYTADEQTFQAVAQWRPKTESRTVFGVYKMPERPIPVAVRTKMCLSTTTRSQRLWV